MYEDVPLAYVNFYQGGTYSEGWALADEVGNPLLASDGWTGRAEFRTDYGGALVVAFAASGADGTVAFDNEGNVTLSLPSSFTATLEASTPNPRILVGDLEVWQTSAPTVRYKALLFRARVFPEVTTS